MGDLTLIIHLSGPSLKKVEIILEKSDW